MRHADPSDQEGGAVAPAADASPPVAVTGAKSLTADEAAQFLYVSLATLHAWERQFGFPTSLESEHADRDYLISELVALQDALSEALSVSSAIHAARRQFAHARRRPLPLATTASQLDTAGAAHKTADRWRDHA